MEDRNWAISLKRNSI